MAGKATEEATLWERLERPARAPRQRLSGRIIAAKAVAIADEQGLCAVTMRSLATALEVAPMAAYRFVGGKDDLFALMVNEVYAELALPEGEWRVVLRAFAERTRALMHRHRWLAELPPHAAMAPTPNRVLAVDRALAALDGLGLTVDAMAAAVRAVGAYVHGAAGEEVALGQVVEQCGLRGRDEVREALAPQMRWLLGTGRFPVYERYIYEAGCAEDPQEVFEAGLGLVLDGIAARVAAAGA
ncbi:TetR/AcrR family transcriptional regulator C-terminal domain-containing protein [Glycomyces sp. A-F 0318]|uniref:TetR/AcrR family transcriptional regulator C-terminal domain-containing protein n=1 Tax=Glycomyces amatae TaxID=2881355 RepID=UPI001E5AD898|nr:TetR/AcrR family transcriptional regulator C-terminal domain-containing protein [Glycomyces amatae]MCD0446012.1 TetR/AcrR family transcriptional regulator C-terminal domain-containing protein [Glycomyces amatae]